MLDYCFWQGRRVLLTGHTGFKGSWLSLWLSQLGAEVCGISLEPDTNPSLFDQLGLANQLSGHHLIDICDSSAVASLVAEFQPQVVLHLAAQPLVRRSYEDPLRTWEINVQGSLNLLEALKPLRHHCSVVMVTTDKVYANKEWDYGYREDDQLGGHDPYSGSKAAAELAIACWRSSFCGNASHQTPHLSIATARAGNVIGGGDWALDRIIPDAMRSLSHHEPIPVRSPRSTRPWQHVLEPLGAYMLLAEKLAGNGDLFSSSYNFGPTLEANRSVRELVETALIYWKGSWQDCSDASAPHEAGRLHLQIDKAYHKLGWTPKWTFEKSVEKTVKWYKNVHQGSDALKCCISDIKEYCDLLTS